MPEAEVPDRRPAHAVVAARPGLSRRAVLGAAAAGTAGLVVGRIAGPLFPSDPPETPRPAASEAATATASVHPFFGPQQAGVTTPAQDHLHLAAFDMVEGTKRRDLVSLLRDWTAAAARMTAGLQIATSGTLGEDPEAPPEDTGETLDLTASRLTV